MGQPIRLKSSVKRMSQGRFFQAHGRLDAAQIGLAIGERLLQLTGDEALARALKRLADRADHSALTDAAMRRTPYFCAGCPHNTSTQVPKGSRALAGIGLLYGPVDGS